MIHLALLTPPRLRTHLEKRKKSFKWMNDGDLGLSDQLRTEVTQLADSVKEYDTKNLHTVTVRPTTIGTVVDEGCYL